MSIHTKMTIVAVLASVLLISGQVICSAECLPEKFCDLEPAGFRGIDWGTNIFDVRDMKLIKASHNGKMRVYIKENENLSFADTGIERVTYSFWEGRFVEIFINTSGSENWHSLKDSIFSLYGPGIKDNTYEERYDWHGKITSIHLDHKSSMKMTSLVFTSAKDEEGIREHILNEGEFNKKGSFYKFK
ncbi:MAG: hypothetical protein JSV21_05580 [Nitrospirota bacterium]|nr:MAG: hypothetical protein JSV21_05580 [Nitrospirota bacterium]